MITISHEEGGELGRDYSCVTVDTIEIGYCESWHTNNLTRFRVYKNKANVSLSL